MHSSPAALGASLSAPGEGVNRWTAVAAGSAAGGMGSSREGRGGIDPPRCGSRGSESMEHGGGKDYQNANAPCCDTHPLRASGDGGCRDWGETRTPRPTKYHEK